MHGNGRTRQRHQPPAKRRSFTRLPAGHLFHDLETDVGTSAARTHGRPQLEPADCAEFQKGLRMSASPYIYAGGSSATMGARTGRSR